MILTVEQNKRRTGRETQMVSGKQKGENSQILKGLKNKGREERREANRFDLNYL